MTEYLTTTVAVANFYDPVGKRLPVLPVHPPGKEWKLVATAATESIVFYTWKRSR